MFTCFPKHFWSWYQNYFRLLVSGKEVRSPALAPFLVIGGSIQIHGCWEDYIFMGLATALQPAVKELHPKKEHKFRLASSLHISYLLPLAPCSEQAGLSPSQYEQPCFPTEFHQNAGHLHSEKVKWHCFLWDMFVIELEHFLLLFWHLHS